MQRLFKNSFSAQDSFMVGSKEYQFFSLSRLEDANLTQLSRLPFSIKILLENVLRNEDGRLVTEDDVKKLAAYNPTNVVKTEVPYMPARVVMQDFTGVPAVVDLAALRDAMQKFGGDPAKINPLVRTDLVIDHSVQVDRFGTADAFKYNVEREYERNKERYILLRWAQQSFRDFRVVPPGTGIVHQVNLEYLASVVASKEQDGATMAFPDTLVGTDSHTTMINGLSVMGWGVGGIEAEAVMLGQPYYMLTPEVVGFKFYGELPDGSTATDLVLTVTQMLRERGVVGKFVEFFGSGLSNLSLADRATIANMAPEYGATMGFFPVDFQTLAYLRLSGRSEELIDLVETYCKEQTLFRTEDTPEPEFADTLELNLESVEATIAGPKRPQDKVLLKEIKADFQTSLKAPVDERGFALSENDLTNSALVRNNGDQFELRHGSIVIAAITSCTNTSNPFVMVAAALLAKNALAKGIRSKPWVKTSLAPGSKVVMEYLEKADLVDALAEQRFNLVGFGCTTCIGNSGPLPQPIAEGIKKGNLIAASVLSGNRNFEGRIHPQTRANYLASPPLVVAYALAGRIDFDFSNEPLGEDDAGNPVFLRDIWPGQQQISDTVRQSISPEMFREQYAGVFDGDEKWQALSSEYSEIYPWDSSSTYIKNPPFFENMKLDLSDPEDIRDARVLVFLGDSTTTDHISPAGAIPVDGPAGKYLVSHGVEQLSFNSFGSRRGNHEVMMRGTFANIRIKNKLAPGTEGGVTIYFPTGEQTSIYEAAMQYIEKATDLIVIAGKEYGTGSSRDWAAKGTGLLGVKAVIAESYERIHRSNLLGMGILPLQFKAGESASSLNLSGKESYTITGISSHLSPGKILLVKASDKNNPEKTFEVLARLDTHVEVDYYRNGGILQTVLRNLLKE